MNRNEIMYDCPEEFQDCLKEILDEIEERVKDIKNCLEISSLSDLCNIEEAYSRASDLCKDLY